jgi:hypothetical protein
MIFSAPVSQSQFWQDLVRSRGLACVSGLYKQNATDVEEVVYNGRRKDWNGEVV